MIKNIIKFLKNIRIQLSSYCLDLEESAIWHSISQKARDGYLEWIENREDRNREIYPCYTQMLQPCETELLKKIHDRYFGKDFYIAFPLGPNQVNWIMYQDICDKVRYNKEFENCVKFT